MGGHHHAQRPKDHKQDRDRVKEMARGSILIIAAVQQTAAPNTPMVRWNFTPLPSLDRLPF